MNTWITLITTLPTENATARMRAWRNLKTSGAAVLRDGVYLMPDQPACQETLEGIGAEVLAAGGHAWVLRLEATEASASVDFIPLFDRSADFARLIEEITTAHGTLNATTAHAVHKQARKLRKTFSHLVSIDFFPNESQKQADAALSTLEQNAAWALSPDEPRPCQADIPPLALADYQGRVWATRARPWVDRLACGWLIRRFIDPQASLVWIKTPADCPPTALGFDFEGARFSHVGARVSFEVLLASFGLETPALQRIGALVHFLDVGGVPVPEASGIESALAGLRETLSDDDHLLSVASTIFDGLWASFEKNQRS